MAGLTDAMESVTRTGLRTLEIAREHISARGVSTSLLPEELADHGIGEEACEPFGMKERRGKIDVGIPTICTARGGQSSDYDLIMISS